MPQVCGNSSWLIPLGLSLPYAWRFCQCLRVNRDTGNRSQLYNALKYSTAFPVVLFSYMNYHTDEASWVAFYRPLWVLSALLNSAYSYFWDVERDWEVQWFTAPAGWLPCSSELGSPFGVVFRWNSCWLCLGQSSCILQSSTVPLSLQL